MTRRLDSASNSRAVPILAAGQFSHVPLRRHSLDNTGASGGTAGQHGAGGTAGSGGAVVLDLPGSGIPCGETTCAEGSEIRCIGGSDSWCDANQCSAAIARLECDDSAHCPGRRCCYTNILAANAFWTSCMPECAGSFDTQVCSETAECDNGKSCRLFVCGNADVSFVLGFCAATASMFCE